MDLVRDQVDYRCEECIQTCSYACKQSSEEKVVACLLTVRFGKLLCHRYLPSNMLSSGKHLDRITSIVESAENEIPDSGDCSQTAHQSSTFLLPQVGRCLLALRTDSHKM